MDLWKALDSEVDRKVFWPIVIVMHEGTGTWRMEA